MELPDYKGAYTREDAVALAEADRVLAARGFERERYPGEETERMMVSAGANATTGIRTVQGNRAITHFKIRFDEFQYPTPGERQEMLDNLWIKITWDNDLKPSVLAPVGIFFWDLSGYLSIPLLPRWCSSGLFLFQLVYALL